MNTIGFGFWNWVALILYLLLMLAVGAFFTRRAGKDTESFFTASGRLPSWVVGFSIYATTLSAITFMSTPEKSFLTDWSYIAGNIAIVAIIPLLIYFYIPFFKKLHVTSAYEYLEARFNPAVRVIGSLLFVLFHLGRIAIVIYLPTLAITAVSDINPYVVACLVGLLCIIYTFLGGFEGVVWSDFIQGVILLGGAIIIIIMAISQVDGGFSTVVHDAIQNKKLISADNWKLSASAAAIPIIFIGSVFNNLQQYTASQDVVQRYQASESMKETAQSIWTNGILALISAPIFFGMGTALYAFYEHQITLPNDFNTSSIVPYFILTQMPPFLGGLLIAAIFAAAQSTISSSLNSISACISIDIKQRFFGKQHEKAEVRFARLTTIVVGLISLIASLYLIASNSSDMWDLFLLITGLFGVPLAGIFAVGIFTKRTHGTGVIVGLIIAVIVSYFLQGVGGAGSPFYTSIIAFFIAFGTAYLSSLILPNTKKDITGLTIYEKHKHSTYVRK
ncbi:sodium:solute symporter [Staphylococcus hyicus]|uniref:Sodium:solute symporter n=2 Tax=Staphylococcus hyicus TaxID=1284 RepID=A0ACD5FP82_STAHY|nr:sodium:solute symporter [Staphylococcus hyicus]MCQ9300303.1 sodium:solute symporter [Staphylococcus hyicus]MDP4449165.1 sodium:solute symporter [Staphylococcus hyicus]MDP4463003.1 sodium:solute symporter [Staphylococcus hyicus]MDP4469010.1 sodium:solute symporter [Staphylococcus hyicus]NJH81815.1 sodium/solute symporter [Staphylococcus hyicus]